MGLRSTIAAGLLTLAVMGIGFLCLDLAGVFEEDDGSAGLRYGFLAAVGILGAATWGIATRYLDRR